MLLDLLDSSHGMPCWVHQETRVGTSQFLTAVECAGTHFGRQALFRIEMSQPEGINVNMFIKINIQVSANKSEVEMEYTLCFSTNL